MQRPETLHPTLEVLKELMKMELKNYNASDNSHELAIGKRALCPNTVMNERHKMARNRTKALQAKLFPTPSELKYVAAKKTVREENSKILLYEKEKRFVTRAITQVEREFSNRRSSVSLSLPDLEKQKRPINMDVHKVFEKKDKHTPNNPVDFLTNIQKAYKKLHCNISRVQYFKEFVPDKQQFTSQAINEKIVKLSPITPKENFQTNNKRYEHVNAALDVKIDISSKREKSKPHSIVNGDNNNPCPKREEITFESLDVKVPAQNLTDNLTERIKNVEGQAHNGKIFYFWTVWRMVTLKSKKEHHKLKRIKKIDSFLMRLTKTAEQIQNLENLAESVSCKEIQKKSFAHPIERKKLLSETEKSRKLDEIEKELAESSIDIFERLQKNLKNFHPNLQPKLKALSVLTNVKKKYKNVDPEPRRVYPTPTFVVEMENRYKERKRRWENIRKRRSEMEAEKERIMKEREEEVKKMEDLKKREKLEELKEKRRRENEIKEQRGRERRMVKQQLRLAQDHYTSFLMKKVGFQPWTRLIQLRRNQMKRAGHHSQVRTCRTFLMHWRQFSMSQLELKRRKIQELYERILLKRSFQTWMLQHDEYVQKIQVAVDWAEAKLSEKTFMIWFDKTRAERWYFMHKIEIAESFHERKALKTCLKNWKEFPEMVRKEREKEERKKLWQRKVQEFLPDYQPAVISEI